MRHSRICGGGAQKLASLLRASPRRPPHWTLACNPPGFSRYAATMGQFRPAHAPDVGSTIAHYTITALIGGGGMDI